MLLKKNTDDNQPANKHSNSLFLPLMGTVILQSHSQQTSSVAERLCVKQAVLDLIPSDNQIFLISYSLTKSLQREREYI